MKSIHLQEKPAFFSKQDTHYVFSEWEPAKSAVWPPVKALNSIGMRQGDDAPPPKSKRSPRPSRAGPAKLSKMRQFP
jgi:hypothetical protein